MTTWEFPAPDPIILDVKLQGGSVTVSAEPIATATVSLTPARSDKRGEELIAATTVEFDAGTLTISVPDRVRLLGSTPLNLTVRLPHGSSCQLKAASSSMMASASGVNSAITKAKGAPSGSIPPATLAEPWMPAPIGVRRRGRGTTC